jgi:hypothetical protein
MVSFDFCPVFEEHLRGWLDTCRYVDVYVRACVFAMYANVLDIPNVHLCRYMHTKNVLCVRVPCIVKFMHAWLV